MKLYRPNLIPRGREKRLDKTAPVWKWVYLESCLADWARTNSKFKVLTERLAIDKYTNQQILQEIWDIDINIKQRIEPKQVDALMVDDREQNIYYNDRNYWRYTLVCKKMTPCAKNKTPIEKKMTPIAKKMASVATKNVTRCKNTLY